MSESRRVARCSTESLWFLRVLVLLAAALSFGCTTTITPPRSPVDPVPVFLLDHGRTSSLVLPRADRTVRYAYGDWN